MTQHKFGFVFQNHFVIRLDGLLDHVLVELKRDRTSEYSGDLNSKLIWIANIYLFGIQMVANWMVWTIGLANMVKLLVSLFGQVSTCTGPYQLQIFRRCTNVHPLFRGAIFRLHHESHELTTLDLTGPFAKQPFLNIQNPEKSSIQIPTVVALKTGPKKHKLIINRTIVFGIRIPTALVVWSLFCVKIFIWTLKKLFSKFSLDRFVN